MKYLSRISLMAAAFIGGGAELSAQQNYPPIRPGNVPGTISISRIKPNLGWSTRQSYALDGPMTRDLDVDGLGINDVVDVFQNIQPFTISRDFNTPAPVAANYFNSLRIRQMIFGSYNFGSQVVTGWFNGDSDAYTVYEEVQNGFVLGPNGTARASFGPIDPAANFVSNRNSLCGLYEVTLRVDSDDNIEESNEQDNEVTHYFFIPSDQVFNISVSPNGALTAPSTHVFEVTDAGGIGPPNPQAYFVQFSQNPLFTGLALTTVPKHDPNLLRSLPFNIEMTGRPKGRGINKSTLGKITVISADGCVVKQETAGVNAAAPGVIPVGPVYYNENGDELEEIGGRPLFTPLPAAEVNPG